MKFVDSRENALGRMGQGVVAIVLALSLTACSEGQKFQLGDVFKKKPAAGAEAADEVSRTRMPGVGGKTIERDVEAPDVFQATEAGLWDGRPSLGGVWVAHPDVKEPERVIIRNEASGKFVVGALFRRERENPGPRLQVSSDAADSLGMLAGQPMKLNVTALRREEIVDEPAEDATETAMLDAPAEVEARPLDPIAGAAAAIDKAEGKAEAKNTANPAEVTGAPLNALKPVSATPADAPKPMPKAKPAASGLAKPYIQIGIFSVEKNANNTGVAMKQAGMLPTIKKQSIKGKPFWRVLIGPANTSAEQAELLKKVKASGFTDAYYVTN